MARKAEQRTNVAAAEATISALDATGRLESVDAAVVQAVRSMAEHLDQDPGNAALWRQYREAVRELRADDGGPLGDDIEDLFSPARDET